MNLRRILLAVTTIMMAWSLPARADSPLTSTEFWKAYRNVPEVALAHDIERLNTRLANYLLSKAPIDRKAAVVNALAWNFHGRENAVLFRDVLSQKYKMAPAAVEARLTPEECFCLAYLTALDDYFHPQRASKLAARARKGLPRSFTVAMVGALIRAQMEMRRLEKVWPMVQPVLDDRHLVQDMRPAGRAIIVDYLRLYRPEALR